MKIIKMILASIGVGVSVLMGIFGVYIICTGVIDFVATVIFNIIYGIKLDYLYMSILQVLITVSLLGWMLWSLNYILFEYSERKELKKEITVKELDACNA